MTLENVLRLLGIKEVRPLESVTFETRRVYDGEKIIPSELKGIVENKYLWEIIPMHNLDLDKVRLNSIYDEINEFHLPALDEDDCQRKIELISGVYVRRETLKFGKKKSDTVSISSIIKYKNTTKNKNENR